MSESVIQLALEYYDKLYDKFEPIFEKIVDHIRAIRWLDLERNTITYYDKNKNIVLQSKYEILGVYNNTQKIWFWAWADPSMKKNEIYISRKLLNYGFDIDTDQTYLLKSELITSRFIISNKIQVEIHIALAAYLSKKVVYKYIKQETVEGNKVTYYIFLLDIDPEENIETYLNKVYEDDFKNLT
jgi:hypothetical protein